MSRNDPLFITPDWPAPAHVRALSTTRRGGCSQPPFDTLNLGTHVGDEAQAVASNRQRLRQHLPAEPFWLNQVHGSLVVEASPNTPLPDADASITQSAGQVCAIMTADCLPVLFCNRNGDRVAAAHAGWRGLCNGILENTVAAMQCTPGDIMAWLGPAIGPQAFEVGEEVRTAFLAHSPTAASAFQPAPSGKWLADLYQLARQRLAACGVTQVYGGEYCTYQDQERFFSYRRDGKTGRMASLIWLE